MNNVTISSSTFTLKPTGGGANVNGTVSVVGNTAIFTPSADLGPGTQYTAAISSLVRDALGIALTSNYSWNFTTGAAIDTTPPTVSSTSPADSANNIATNSSVAVTFSEPMTSSSLNTTSFTLVKTTGGTAVSGTITVASNGATFKPSSALANSTNYTATISTAAKDAAGNTLAASYSWSFTTAAAADTTPPTVSSTTPQDGSLNVALNSSVSATFSEAMTNSTITTASFTLRTGGGTTVVGTVSVSGNTARFTPSANLAGSTQYFATISTAVKDAAGNAMAAAKTWSFSTAPAPDTTPPTVQAVAPLNGASGVALPSTVSAIFSEAMKNSTVSTATFKLAKTSNGAAVSGTVSMNGNTATFTPSANLAVTTQYTATITTGVQDAAGNAMTSAFTWSFTTTGGDTTPPTVSSVSPLSGSTGVALDSAVSVTFSEAMTNSTLNTTTVKLAKTSGNVAISGFVTVSGNTATMTPSADLDANTGYTATVTTGAQDKAGNALTSNFTWTFTTSPPVNGTANLQWDAATASNLLGYRVYYGFLPGQYLQTLGSGFFAGNVLTYQVVGLNRGVDYYFAVTAVDTLGNESNYSNEVTKHIP